MVSTGETMSVDFDENDHELVKSADEFTISISRGGLIHPSDLLYLVCVHAWAMWIKIRDDKKIFREFMGKSNQRNVFVESFMEKLTEAECTQPIINAACNQKHSFNSITKIACTVIFNGMASNLSKVQNSKMHAGRKRESGSKTSTLRQKVLKLKSGNSSTTNVFDNSIDCGICKFCLDKPKNGGKGTLRQRCVNKQKNVSRK